MGETIPVPIWAVLAMMLLLVVREFFLARRDEAVRDLFRMYMDATADTPSTGGRRCSQ